jgi:hypothetical protein
MIRTFRDTGFDPSYNIIPEGLRTMGISKRGALLKFTEGAQFEDKVPIILKMISECIDCGNIRLNDGDTMVFIISSDGAFAAAENRNGAENSGKWTVAVSGDTAGMDKILPEIFTGLPVVKNIAVFIEQGNGMVRPVENSLTDNLARWQSNEFEC